MQGVNVHGLIHGKRVNKLFWWQYSTSQWVPWYSWWDLCWNCEWAEWLRGDNATRLKLQGREAWPSGFGCSSRHYFGRIPLGWFLYPTGKGLPNLQCCRGLTPALSQPCRAWSPGTEPSALRCGEGTWGSPNSAFKVAARQQTWNIWEWRNWGWDGEHHTRPRSATRPLSRKVQVASSKMDQKLMWLAPFCREGVSRWLLRRIKRIITSGCLFF